MQGANPTDFEKWCADEIGLTESYVKSKRKINILGMLQYRNAEIEKRFMAYKAGLVSGASIGCSDAKAKGTNWVKCTDKMPELGKPLLIIASGKLRKFTYYLDIVDCAESYRFFQFADEDSWVSKFLVTHWMYVDSIPLPPMPEGE